MLDSSVYANVREDSPSNFGAGSSTEVDEPESIVELHRASIKFSMKMNMVLNRDLLSWKVSLITVVTLLLPV